MSIKKNEAVATLEVAANEKYMLGEGVFSIGETQIAITRGGGVFEVIKEYRPIEHDGARGEYVKGMISLDRATPKLTVNSLSILDGTDFEKMYANIKVTNGGSKNTVTGTFTIEDKNYADVKFKGFTSDGKAVEITVKSAINLENINWELVDKNEVIHALTYVGCYTRGSKEQPWQVVFGAE